MDQHIIFKPKILSIIKNYSWTQLRSDCIAGIVVGVIALPLAIAFAIASGVSPDKGLVTAVVAGFIISALGGSRVQIGGPTGAFVVVVYSIVQQHGIEGLVIATMMGGLMILLMGLCRFGSVIKFIPYPLTVGFTSGIGVVIFSSQVKDLLGLQMDQVPAHFFEKWEALYLAIHSFNPYAFFIGTLSIVGILIWQRYIKKVPGAIVVLIVGTLIVQFFHLPVETIYSRFGSIPNHLPMPHFPTVSFAQIQQLIPAAFTIALLGSIESLLSAVVADGMIGGRHRSNTELIAQGIANISSGLFGGIPATGAIARTALNVHNGGRTPIAGIVHAITLLLIMVLFGRWVQYVPLSLLAGILILVAYRMCEWKSFAMILKAPKGDVAVLLLTFFLTVVVDLTVALEVGMVLAAFLFMQRVAQATNFTVMTDEFKDEELRDDPLAIDHRVIPQGVEVYEINGPFFFGVASTFLQTILMQEKKPRVRILRMRHVPTIDATALNALQQVVKSSQKNGIQLILSGVNAQVLSAIEKVHIDQTIGKDNICPNIDSALLRAEYFLLST